MAMIACASATSGANCPPQPLESTAQNCFYPAVPRLAPTTRGLLSDSPSLLATVGLLEQLEKQPPRQQYFGNLLQFTPETLPKGTLQATLTNSRIPGRAEQQQYASLLRTSWPNRRFKLATATPLWQWEALHLLGLYRTAEPLALTLPDCDRAIAAVERAGVKLMMGHVRQFDAGHVEAKRFIGAGAIGQPLVFRAISGDVDPPPPSFAAIAVYRSRDEIWGRIAFPPLHSRMVGASDFLVPGNVEDLVAYIVSLEE